MNWNLNIWWSSVYFALDYKRHSPDFFGYLSCTLKTLSLIVKFLIKWLKSIADELTHCKKSHYILLYSCKWEMHIQLIWSDLWFWSRWLPNIFDDNKMLAHSVEGHFMCNNLLNCNWITMMDESKLSIWMITKSFWNPHL